jgi:hypothetical protein
VHVSMTKVCGGDGTPFGVAKVGTNPGTSAGMEAGVLKPGAMNGNKAVPGPVKNGAMVVGFAGSTSGKIGKTDGGIRGIKAAAAGPVAGGINAGVKPGVDPGTRTGAFAGMT